MFHMSDNNLILPKHAVQCTLMKYHLARPLIILSMTQDSRKIIHWFYLKQLITFTCVQAH